MASNKKKRLEAIADHLALQASQEPQDEFIMDLVSTPEGIVVNTNEAVDFFKASDVMIMQAELVPNDNNNAQCLMTRTSTQPLQFYFAPLIPYFRLLSPENYFYR